MPALTFSLSSFTRTNTDMPSGQTFTAYASGSTVANARVTSGSLYLSAVRTYSGSCYLTLSLNGATASTSNFSNNSATHSETLSLSSISGSLLTTGSGTVTFTVQRSVSGSGNLLNLRAEITGTLTINYEMNYTACGAPTACSVNSTVSEGNVTLSWSGATGGTLNAINSYEIQYSESSDGANWGAWTALSTVSTTATSGSLSVAPPGTRGYYRRFQVRTRGDAGASYYSGWRVSSNSVRRNTLPTAPATFTASPTPYWNQDITLSWSGAAAGTSAIASYTIQYCTSADGTAWGGWAALATVTSSATSGSRVVTPSQTQGTYTKYRISVTDTLSCTSAFKESNSILCAITACGAPTACSVSAALAEGSVTLSWSGAVSGSGNTISAYEIQYSDSVDNASWDAWTALSVVNSASTSGTQTVDPPDNRGLYRRFQVRARGSAGASYYSAWKVSSNSVRKNILPSPPTTFTSLPEVYEVNNITLTWSGIIAGTSAITQTVIQVSTSANGGAWSAYELLATINGAATSGTRAATPSNEAGVLTRYRIAVVDTLGGMSAYVVSNTVRKLSPPSPPTIIAPQPGRTTYNTRPRFLIRTGDASTQMQAVCVQNTAGAWEDSANNTERFSPSGYLAENIGTIYRHPETAPGSKSVSFRAFAQNTGVPGAEVSRSFTVAASPFEVITANETKVKATHILALRTAVNNVRRYYGLAAITWSEVIAAGRTPIRNWTFHVLELRSAIEQVIELINNHAPGSMLGVPIPVWLPPAPGRPKAAVMLQLQDVIREL